MGSASSGQKYSEDLEDDTSEPSPRDEHFDSTDLSRRAASGELSSFGTVLGDLADVVGGNRETARLLRHSQDLLLPLVTSAEPNTSLEPFRPQRRVYQHYAQVELLDQGVPPAGAQERPRVPSEPLSPGGTAKDKVRLSLELAPVDLVYATPSALVLTWSPSGWNPNDFRPVDEYEMQWRMATAAEVAAGRPGGAGRHHRGVGAGARGSGGANDKRDKKELHVWAAPSSARWGHTRVNFWCCATEWRTVPRRALRFFDRTLVVQGLPPGCAPLFFRVRGNSNSVWGAFSDVESSIRTWDKLRQPAPRVRSGTGSVTAHTVDLVWDPFRHYDKRASVLYTLRCQLVNSGGALDGAAGDDAEPNDVVYEGTACHFRVGGEGEEPLKPDSLYRFTVAASWTEVDGTLCEVESEPPTEARTPPALRPVAPARPTLVEGSAKPTSLVIQWTPPRGNEDDVEAYHLYGGAVGEASRCLYVGRSKRVAVGVPSPAEPGADAEVEEARSEPLMPNSAYAFCVAAANAYGRGDFSDELACRTVGVVGDGEDDPARMATMGAPQDRPVCTVDLPHTDGWIECWTMHPDLAACCYYFHSETQTTQWEYPESDIPDADRPFRYKRFKFLWDVWRRSPPEGEGLARGVVRPPNPHSMKCFEVQLRRTHLIYDSFRAFSKVPSKRLRERMKVVFEGESGIDSGGITKDWFIEITRELVNPALCLFQPVAKATGLAEGAHAHTFGIDARSGVNNEHLSLVDLPLSPVIYKHMLGLEPSLEDLRDLDPVLCRSLEWMLNNDITDVIDETFTVLEDDFGAKREVEIIPGGAAVAVTESNKRDYVRAIVQRSVGLQGSTKEQLHCLLDGLHELVPSSELSVFSVEELDLLLNGRSELDVEQLRRCTQCKGGYEDEGGHECLTLRLFWEVLANFGSDETAALLQFATGASKVPLDGFDPPFTIVRSQDDRTALPTSHTCFNQLVLPPYESKDEVKERLLFAITNTAGFHRS